MSISVGAVFFCCSVYGGLANSDTVISSSKYSPSFNSDKSIERYRKLVKKVNKRVVKDKGTHYYHQVISGGEAYFKLYRKLVEKEQKANAGNSKSQNYPDLRSGSEIVRVHLSNAVKADIKNALKEGRGLVLPVFKLSFRISSGINVVFDWPKTEKLYAILKETLELDLQPLQFTRKWAEELRAYRSDGHEFTNDTEAEIIKRLTFKPDFIINNGLVRDYYENFIKYGNEEHNEQKITSLTERLINGEGSSINILPVSHLSNVLAPVSCRALNLSELKINNKPKPRTVGDLLFRLEGAIRRSAARRTKSIEACMTGFKKLLG